MLSGMSRARAAAAAVALVALVAGCSSSSSGGAPSAGSGTTLPPVSPCPTPTVRGATFPPGPPSHVPHPFFATSPKRVPVDVSGVQELSFTTAMALRDAAAFVQQWYPAAGYRIIGGDSEEHEADIDWATANFHGKTRLSGVGACTTDWLVLTVEPGATAPPIAEPDARDSS